MKALVYCFASLFLSIACYAGAVHLGPGQATLRFLTTSSLYPNLSGNRVENNILAFGASVYINGSQQPATAATIRKNIFFSIINPSFNGPYWDTPELDPIKDPNPMIYGSGTKMFVDGAGKDFNLADGGPAIWAGASEAEPIYDFYGRKFSNQRSIGAVEYIGSGEVGNLVSKDESIFPNPASDFIEISYSPSREGTGGVSIEIYNVFGIKEEHPPTPGSTPFNSPASGGQIRVDVSGLPAGVYFVRVGDKIRKFVKL